MTPRICYLPRLKVHALPSGEIVTGHRETPLPPAGDEWWSGLLLDPRARVPTEPSLDADGPYAAYRLDRQRDNELMIACECGRHGAFDKASLITQVGGGMNVIYLARHLLDCDTRNKVTNNCRAYCVR